MEQVEQEDEEIKQGIGAGGAGGAGGGREDYIVNIQKRTTSARRSRSSFRMARICKHSR